MSKSTFMSLTEARRRIFEIAERVQHPNIIYTLTQNGQPKVVMMSAEEFDSRLETMETLYDFPDLRKDIAEYERDKKAGRDKKYITLEEMRAKYKKCK